MRKEGKPQPFIIMTDYAEVHTAVESMKLGSADYIPKQLVEDRLVPLIRSIHKAQEQKGTNKSRYLSGKVRHIKESSGVSGWLHHPYECIDIR